ncbi:MAG: hypothetical protein K9N35_05875 [Candidatus Marinimicrobia bacterium]|nr:hypothetical protein [Candidatus Neomarinimicrobiota bacterium]
MKTILPVPRVFLLLVSGLMWSVVGFMLISMATRWLSSSSTDVPWTLIFTAILAGFVISQVGFTSLVQKNIRRIEQMDATRSIFSFQSRRSYIMIVIMISIGFFIRRTGIIPLIIKTPGYFTMGTALSLSSIKYYREFFNVYFR